MPPKGILGPNGLLLGIMPGMAPGMEEVGMALGMRPPIGLPVGLPIGAPKGLDIELPKGLAGVMGIPAMGTPPLKGLAEKPPDIGC